MILLALAAAAAMQWTGPRTVEYNGPGYFCGGGYAIHLAQGDRALILPQGHGGAQGTRLVLAGREVNVWNGAPPQPGPMVLRYPGGAVTQQAYEMPFTASSRTAGSSPRRISRRGRTSRSPASPPAAIELNLCLRTGHCNKLDA